MSRMDGGRKMMDCIIIGGGPAGYETALYAAKKGLQVTLIEKEYLGGTCLNKGCIPTKTLLHHSAKIAPSNYELLYDYQKQVVEQLRKGIATQLEKQVNVIFGQAKIIDAHHVLVEEQVLETKNIIIATGSLPLRPSFMIENENVMTSDELLERKQPIKHLVIIGGGVIGVEFALIYHRLQTKVTILEASNQLLPLMDKDIAQNLKMIYKKKGIEVHTDSCVTQIEEGLQVHFMEKEEEKVIDCDAILVAIGRRANSEDLFIHEPCAMQKGKILVNEFYETSIPSIYAIGDVNGQFQLAHAATAQGKNVICHLLHESMPYDLNLTPQCIYVEPEIACVGINEKEAKEKGIEIQVKKAFTYANGKSVLTQQERGFVKLLVNPKTQEIYGAQLMCARASDMISELTCAIQFHLTLSQLSQVIHPHPTFSEIIADVCE